MALLAATGVYGWAVLVYILRRTYARPLAQNGFTDEQYRAAIDAMTIPVLGLFWAATALYVISVIALLIRSGAGRDRVRD